MKLCSYDLFIWLNKNWYRDFDCFRKHDSLFHMSDITDHVKTTFDNVDCQRMKQLYRKQRIYEIV